MQGVLSHDAPPAGTFPGIYCSALPALCWAADSRRLVLDTAQRSQQVRGHGDTWRGRGGARLDSALLPLGRVCGGHTDGCHDLSDSR